VTGFQWRLAVLGLGLWWCGTQAQPALAAQQMPATSHPAVRSWVDKRIDRLTAQELTNKTPAMLVDPDRARVAETLVGVRRPLFFLWSFAQIFVLFWAWRCGFAAVVRDALANRIANLHVLRACYSAIWVFIVSLTALPFSLVSWHLARMVGVSREGLSDFLHDALIATSLEIGIVAVVLVLILGLVDRTRLWYFWATGGALAFGLFALLLTPIVIDPLFHTLTPLDPHSREGRRIFAVEQRARMDSVPIFVTNLSRTSEVGNANVEGIGPTRRVLIGDSLLRTAVPDEITFVTAHEFGHLVFGDTLSLTFLADVLSILAIAAAMLTVERIPVRGDDDPLSRLPLIAALVGVYSLAFFPIGNAFSRHAEARADQFALSITHDPVSASRMFVRFADEGFAPLCPPQAVRLYFYDHPPLGSRISSATNRPDVCP
jgi:STE24 endopeptidase